MRISELAKSAGIGVETVRYYQRIGLLNTPERPAGSIRLYRKADTDRLRFIRRAQQLGFSLQDVGSLLRLSSDDCQDVQALAQRKLGLVREKLADLMRMEKALISVLGRCRARAPHGDCPVIEALASRAGSPETSRFICQLKLR